MFALIVAWRQMLEAAGSADTRATGTSSAGTTTTPAGEVSSRACCSPAKFCAVRVHLELLLRPGSIPAAMPLIDPKDTRRHFMVGKQPPARCFLHEMLCRKNPRTIRAIHVTVRYMSLRSVTASLVGGSGNSCWGLSCKL